MSYAIELNNPTPEQMDKLTEVMSEAQDKTVAYIQNLAKELNISEACAMDVFYLRTRRRHTPELELRLIDEHKNGNPPSNMCDWPPE